MAIRDARMLLWCAALGGCTAASPPPATIDATEVSDASAASDPPSPARDVAPPRPLAEGLTITNLVPGHFELESDRAIGLASAARIERRGDDGRWLPIANLDNGLGYRLLASCDETPPACIEIAPGKPLRPVALSGMDCSSQCNGRCRANAWLGPATLRLSVDTCDGKRLDGPAFELPNSTHAESMPRWSMTRDVVSATIMRLHDPDAAKDRAATKDKLLLWRIRPGTERALDPTNLARLLELIAAADGYDDAIMKRCLMDHLVGFRIVREPATTGTPRSETIDVVIDLGCHKFFAGETAVGPEPPIEHATHFDPSRKAWLELVRTALPGDRELARLK